MEELLVAMNFGTVVIEKFRNEKVFNK